MLDVVTDRYPTQNAVGRQLEARVFWLKTRHDVDDCSQGIGLHLMRMKTRLERVAILVARTNATLYMQLNRIVREAGFTARRVVHAAEEAPAHLASLLAPAELARMRDFLDEPAGSVPSARL